MQHKSIAEYEFSHQALYHPEKMPVFRSDMDIPAAFDNSASACSLANAWWCAKMSHLAYYDKDSIEEILKTVGLSLLEFFSRHGSQGFIAGGPGFAILSFRGTAPSAPENLRNDLDFRHAQLSGDLHVHEGFLNSLDEIWPQVDQALQAIAQEDLRLWYTGHSLGAAMAQLAAAHEVPHAVYVFGSPRVGGRRFTQMLQDVAIYRFNRCCDAVPWLPPRTLGFEDAGREIFITSTDRVISGTTKWCRLRERVLGHLRFYRHRPWGKPGTLMTCSLADHSIGNYSKALWNALVR